MSRVSTSWHLRAIGLVRQNHQGATGTGVTVAVIDTGIDLSHHDLLKKVLEVQILPITAVGNQCPPNETWCPACLPESLGVGAVCQQFRVWVHSCSGPCVEAGDPPRTKPDLVAPGENVYTCSRGGSYGYRSGTSFAAPICTGVAALVVEEAGLIEADDLRNVLLASCRLLPDAPDRQGAGLIQIP